MTADIAIWAIAIVATAGVIVRPWRLPEAVWAAGGAVLLVAGGLLSPAAAWAGIARGGDVYLFLAGMMLLAELARREGLFGHLAARAANLARGSARRLFLLVYLVGTLVTVFMSNDATAVVLTPAVAAVARAADAPALPYLLICAFIANAASFLLPIGNPANLVIYGAHLPPLAAWLPRFAPACLLAIAATYASLYLTQRAALSTKIASSVPVPPLGRGGKIAALGIAGAAIALLVASAKALPLGAPTLAAGVLAAGAVLIAERRPVWPLLREISWSVLVLVAGLFVLVEGLAKTGLIATLARAIALGAAHPAAAALAAGVLLALLCNAMNNLPAGLIAGSAVQAAHGSGPLAAGILIGVDLGPNLSVTGSLATILWLAALRREGIALGALPFLRLGAIVMPPALALALLAASL